MLAGVIAESHDLGHSLGDGEGDAAAGPLKFLRTDSITTWHVRFDYNTLRFTLGVLVVKSAFRIDRYATGFAREISPIIGMTKS